MEIYPGDHTITANMQGIEITNALTFRQIKRLISKHRRSTNCRVELNKCFCTELEIYLWRLKNEGN